VNEPQGGRCSKNIKDATSLLKELSNVTISVIPKYMSSSTDPDAPAVVINGKVVAENKKIENGRLSKNKLEEALIKRGAVPYSAGYKVINSEQLKKLVDAKSKDLLVIDARNPEEYQEVHIPRSINLPEKKFAENKHLLPKDKKQQIVFYCNGVKCGKSKRAAKKAVTDGYKNVFVYAEGMPVWEEMSYPIYAGPDYEKKIETTKLSPEEMKAIIDSGATDFTIVDVRDESEFSEGHIPDAINIPVARFAAESGKLDKKKKIIVYCNSGGRSYLGYRKLMKLSYKKIYQTLFADWKEEGMPVAM
ncbi:MAG: rhodanese-like domain-containing protein, partial [Desulfobulbaceae bacterium]|nr:rhodanese-like domain-containing protein [Desulfobulbaceae bacterium]